MHLHINSIAEIEDCFSLNICVRTYPETISKKNKKCFLSNRITNLLTHKCRTINSPSIKNRVDIIPSVLFNTIQTTLLIYCAAITKLTSISPRHSLVMFFCRSFLTGSIFALFQCNEEFL